MTLGRMDFSESLNSLPVEQFLTLAGHWTCSKRFKNYSCLSPICGDSNLIDLECSLNTGSFKRPSADSNTKIRMRTIVPGDSKFERLAFSSPILTMKKLLGFSPVSCTWWASSNVARIFRGKGRDK